MKTTMMSYENAKALFLQGYEMKLPKWEGYWKMNKEKKGIEVHTKDGKILDTPDIMYTFYNNWEVATVQNCPILAKEKGIKDNKKNFKIIDIKPMDLPVVGLVPLILVKIDGEEKPRLLKPSELEKLAGGRKEAMLMIKEFSINRLPKEVQGMARELFSEVDFLIDIVEKLDSEENEADELHEEDIERVLELILEGVIKMRGARG